MPQSDDSLLRLDGERVVATCQVCHFSVTDGAGFLWIDMSDVHSGEEAWREKETRQPGGSGVDLSELMTLPDPAPWRVHHRQCYPFSTVGSYVVEVDRIDTAAKLVRWTAHLMGKQWLRHTNWDEVLQSASGMDMLG